MPRRRTTLHFEQIGFTDDFTFILSSHFALPTGHSLLRAGLPPI